MNEIAKTKKHYQVFSRIFLFNKVQSVIVNRVFLSPECTCARFEAGEKIYTRESFRQSLGIVLSGELKALKNASGGVSIVMNTFSVGGIFGVAGLFHHTEHYVSEIEAKRRSEVLFLPQTLLHQLFLEEPVTAENYIAFLSDRIYFLNTCIDHYTGGSAKDRLVSFLLSLPAVCDDPFTVELPCAMTRVADLLDIGRASLYRAMDELIQEQTIWRDGKRIVLNSGSDA